MFKVGDCVQWTTRKGTKRCGIVHAVVPANEHAGRFLSQVSFGSQVKFERAYAPYTRYIVAVRRGKYTDSVDYYCPRPSDLRADMELEKFGDAEEGQA